MSRHGDITLPWGDGEYKFRLGYGELRDLQEACGETGPARIAATLMPYDAVKNPHGGNWRVEYIRETIRIGLVGAGQSQSEALTLVMKFVDRVPWSENVLIAWAIIAAALSGSAQEPVGKAAEDETKAAPSLTERSPSPNSMAPALQ